MWERKETPLKVKLKEILVAPLLLSIVFWALVILAGCYSCHGGEKVVEISAYCNEGPRGCSICNGRWAAREGYTASGRKAVRGRTIACNWLPFGTKVRIQGFEVPKYVEDRMVPKYGHRIDIFWGSYKGAHRDAKRWGVRKLKVVWEGKDTQ